MTGKTLIEQLTQLRNNIVVGFLVINIMWIIVITLLGYHAKLTVLRTNALRLAFLIVYGSIFCIQFLALIWHRLITIIQLVARGVESGTQKNVCTEGNLSVQVMRNEDIEASINCHDGDVVDGGIRSTSKRVKKRQDNNERQPLLSASNRSHEYS